MVYLLPESYYIKLNEKSKYFVLSHHNYILTVWKKVNSLLSAPCFLFRWLLRLLGLLQLSLDRRLAGRPPLLTAEVAHVLQV